MKILTVCQHYWPDNWLINEINEELVKRGHEVTVLCGLPDYSTSKIPDEYKHGKNRKQMHNGIKIYRVPTIARRKGFVFRVLNYLSFFVNGSIFAYTHDLDFDVIYLYQLAPVLMANPAMIYKKRKKKGLFIYVLDVWPDQMKTWHVDERNPLFHIVLWYCRKAYNAGDRVGVTSEPFIGYLNKICKVPMRKLFYLPQHSNGLSNICNNEAKDTDGPVRLVFAGNIGYQQDLECLLKAISLVNAHRDYVVDIYGNGTFFNNSVELAKALKIEDKVFFHGRVPKESLDSIYPTADAFLLTLCSEDEIGIMAKTVPAKFQGYLSVGKPILAAINGGAADIIKENELGLVVPSGDYKGFANNIELFVDNIEKYKQFGNNAAKYFNDNYRKDLIIDQIENTLHSLC